MSKESAQAYTFGLLLGIITGFLVGSIFIVLIVVGATRPRFAQFVYDFQTLISGALALLGAFAAVWAVFRQIEASQILSAVEQSDRRHAARTLLPSALMAVQYYSDECISFLLAIRPRNVIDLNPDALIPKIDKAAIRPLPILERETVLDLKDCVASSPETVRQALLDLVAGLQILHARLRNVRGMATLQDGLPWHALTLRTLDRRLFDTLLIHARCETLYAYARGKKEGVDEMDLIPSAFNTGLDDGGFPLVFELIKQFESKGIR